MANFESQAANVTTTTAGNFIPEIWSDEIVAAYQSNLVLAPLVKKLSMSGKKGDTIHIPTPTRGSASAKAANTSVTLIAESNTDTPVTINKHFEYSRLIEDIADVQALASMRQFYTQDAGYSLAKQVDSDLFELGQSFGTNDSTLTAHLAYEGTGSYYIDASSGLTQWGENTLVTADVFTDAGFRDLIQKMDDADVPMDGRSLVVPPSVRNSIMGIDRYASSDFVDGRVVGNGQIGNLYGIDIYVSSNCPTIETASANSAGGAVKQGMIFHKDAMVLAEQQGVRSQTQYKQEYLGDLFTTDTIYGTAVVRDDAAFNLMLN
ncbi:MAG: hypothetical protein CME35_00335 [Gramella sp.]|nr:hypothetical protein [Christiangramia sp.]